MRPNTRQRSWSNYVGDRPIESRRGTEFYGDSPRYGPRDEDTEQEEYASGPSSAVGSSDIGTSDWQRLQDRAKARRDISTGQLSDWEQLQRDSALRKGMNSLRGSRVVPSINPIV